VYDLGICAVARYASFDLFVSAPRVYTRGFMLLTRYAGSKSIEFSMAALERHFLKVNLL
jgi:hypothetical protein